MWLLLLPLSCGPGGASSSTPKDAAALAADEDAARRLVPADAALVLRLASIEELQVAEDEFARLFGTPSGLVDTLLASGLPERWLERHLDRGRPVFLALAQPAGGEFGAPVFVLPLRAADGAGASDSALQGFAVHVEGERVALSRAPFAPGVAAGPLAAALPEGPFAVSLDPAALLGPLRAKVAGALSLLMMGSQAPPGGPDPMAFLRAQVAVLFDLCDALESVQVSATLRDGRLVLDGRATAAADTLLAQLPPARTDALDEMLAWAASADAMVQAVVALDAKAFTGVAGRWMREVAAQWPPSAQDDLEELIGLCRVLSATNGHVLASVGGFGLEAAYLIETADSVGTVGLHADLVRHYLHAVVSGDVAQSADTFDGRPSITLEVPLEALLASAPAFAPGSSDELRENLQRMFGSADVLRYVLTATERHVLVSLGDRDDVAALAARIGQPADVLPEVSEAAAAVRDTAAFLLLSIESTRLYSALWSFVVAGAAAQGVDVSFPGVTGPPARWTAWVGGEGQQWTVGARLDLRGLATFLRAAQGATPGR